MASDLIRSPKSIPAGSDLSGNQFYFVKVNSSGQLAVQSSSGAFCDGVLQDTPNAQGQPGQVCGAGDITKVKAGGSVTAGDFVSSTNAGKATTTTSGQHILGRALDTASNGDIFRIIYQPCGKL